jgi:hypothetical protein
MNIENVSPKQLRRAADIQERILDLQRELNAVLGSSDVSSSSASSGTGKRRLSAQGIANIRAGAKRRWAAERALPPEKRPKRKMSAAGRAALAASLRARWARAKTSGRNAL